MLKIKKIENEIFNFIKNHCFEILFFVITVISLKMRINFIDYESEDYNSFLLNWFNQLKNQGGFLAIKLEIGNYNIPYLIIMAILTYIPANPLILIKSVSILFDYAMAITSMLIIYELLKSDKNKHLYALITYSLITILPSVVLNSSAWGQCDSIYVTFILISLLFLIKEKYIKSLIFFGVAISFKLQAIFLLPIYIFVYISNNKKFSLYYFLIIPVVNFVMCLPAIIAGRSLISCMSIYINQINCYNNYISMNFPNIYAMLIDTIGESNLIANPSSSLSSMGTLFTLSIFAITAIIIMYKKVKFNNKQIIQLSLWSVMLCTFLLPSMHDRYLYMADVISIIFFMINRKKFYIPIVINFISLYVYIEYLYATKNLPIQYVAISNFIVLILMSKEIYLQIKGKEKEKI